MLTDIKISSTKKIIGVYSKTTKIVSYGGIKKSRKK